MSSAKILSILVVGMVAIKQVAAQCDGMGVTWGPGIGPPPAGCGRPAAGGGAGAGGGGTCANPPCTASHLGQIAATVVSGGGHDVGTAVYGPFENGFTAQQDNILAQLGCGTGHGYVQGGIDTNTAEQMVAADCSVELPRHEGNRFVSLLDECGHHANHFHEHFGCLWEGRGTTAHSVRIAAVDGVDDQFLYGKYEDEANRVFAEVDACGGHFGFTPESPTVEVYHYHVQDLPPFTLGCIGPAADGGLMTVEECRALDSGCGDGDTATLTVSGGDIEYDLWCPCYDGAGSNVGNAPRAIFAGSTAPATVTTTAEAEDTTTVAAAATTDDAEDTTTVAATTAEAEATTTVAATTAEAEATTTVAATTAEAEATTTVAATSEEEEEDTGNVTGGRPTGTRPVSTGTRPVSTGDRSTGARPTDTRGTGGRPAGGRPRVTGDRTASTTAGPVVTGDNANMSPVAQIDQGDAEATGTSNEADTAGSTAAADAEKITLVLAATAVVAMLVLIVAAVVIRSHRRKGEAQHKVAAQQGQQRDFANPVYEQSVSVNRQDSAAVFA